ncbi:MAG: glutamine synthetase [Promethearchaeota archaeon]|nr:MAG: glutamine synthetase [Candidatus Lokiarchaeota archaeon]
MKDFNNIFEKNKISYIEFQFTTILGEFKSVEFPVKIWDEMKEGTGIDGSSLGFLKTEQSDMQIIPDLDSFRIIPDKIQDPWDTRTGSFICDITDNKGKPYSTCPRGILKKQLTIAADLGYEYITRPELEWYFLKKNLEPADDGSYMDLYPKDKLSYLRRKISDSLLNAEIGIKTIHHEVGPGQHEIEFLPLNALHQADNVQIAKNFIKRIAYDNKFIASFMPKPLSSEAGNGLHIHQYLTKNGLNIFADKEKGISDTLRYYIGGIQKYIDEFSLILNPIPNSYKRLIPNHEAPIYDTWGIANRTALIRVPGYEKSARIEYRAGDAAMNIYLGTAVLLAAGLEGIKKKYDPKEPVNFNVDNLTNEELAKLNIRELPRNFEKALKGFEKSDFIKKVLGKEMKELFAQLKRKEFNNYKKAIDTGNERKWEIDNYLDC